jgi:hypothetical protein
MYGAIISAVLAGARTGAADMAASARRSAIISLIAIVAAVLAAASIGCGLAALWIFSVPRLGPSGAALGAAGCLLVVCLAVLGLGLFILKRHRRPRPSVALPESLLAEAARIFVNDKGTMLVAALVAGLVAGYDSRKQ